MKVVYIKSELLHVMTSAKIDIQHLSKQDVVVVWGGSKDVGKNETKKGINCIQKFKIKKSYKFYIKGHPS